MAEGDVFAIIGRMTEPAWREAEEVLPTFAEDTDDDDDDLDFEMF